MNSLTTAICATIAAFRDNTLATSNTVDSTVTPDEVLESVLENLTTGGIAGGRRYPDDGVILAERHEINVENRIEDDRLARVAILHAAATAEVFCETPRRSHYKQS